MSALLRIPEAAEQLACSENHVYRLIAAGQLRAVDVKQKGAKRSKTRVRQEDLTAFIDAHTQVVA